MGKDNEDTSIDGQMDKIKEQIAVMISEGKGEKYSEQKLKTLRTILNLLQVDKIMKKRTK